MHPCTNSIVISANHGNTVINVLRKEMDKIIIIIMSVMAQSDDTGYRIYGRKDCSMDKMWLIKKSWDHGALKLK